MTVVGIVPAGGSGERLGADEPKAFVALAGRPLLDWSLDMLSPVCDRVVVAVTEGREAPPDRVRGGASRSASVRAALRAAPEADVIVVHDAARPLLTRDLVAHCLAAMRDPDLAGVIAAAPVTDTIKEGGDSAGGSRPPESAGGSRPRTPGGACPTATGDRFDPLGSQRPPVRRVLRTLDRSTLWAVQTPQVFRAEWLRRALDVDDAALAAASDDASLVEAAGGTIAIVESSPENLKVTTPLDLRIAEMLLRARLVAKSVDGPRQADPSPRSGQPC